MKPISFSSHARLQMLLRGAEESEVIYAIREGVREQARRGKFLARNHFQFGKESPVSGRYYKHKTVEAIFADEEEEVVVETVKVYYSNEDII